MEKSGAAVVVAVDHTGASYSSTPATMEMASGDRNNSGDDGTTAGMRKAETLLRLVPMGLCFVALLVMLKNSQSNDYGSVSYSDLGAFRYLVHANGICAGYSLLSAVIVAMPRPSTKSRAWTFFLLDQILTYVILAAATSSMEVLYLAYEGDEAVTWSTACGSFGGFCKKATASVAITFLTIFFYASLSLLSSYKLFSKYDAPIGYSSNGAASVEIGRFY